MQKFTDNAGRSWPISITVGTVNDVRKLLDVNLLDAAGEIFQRLQSDPMLLANVLYVVCRETANALGMTDEDFGRALGGDAIAEATDGLLEALINFFPPHRRAALGSAWRRCRDLDTMAANRIADRMTDPAIEATVSAQVDSFLEQAMATITTPKPIRKSKPTR